MSTEEIILDNNFPSPIESIKKETPDEFIGIGNALESTLNADNTVETTQIDHSAEIADLENQLKNMPKPWKDKKAERKIIQDKIKTLTKKTNDVKIEIDKSTHNPEDVEKYSNLCKKINYNTDVKKLSVERFLLEKQKILVAADKHYSKMSEGLTNFLIRLSLVGEALPDLKGINTDLAENRILINQQIKEILILEGFKPVSISDSLGGPWGAMAITLLGICGTRVMINRTNQPSKAVEPPKEIKKNGFVLAPLEKESHYTNIESHKN